MVLYYLAVVFIYVNCAILSLQQLKNLQISKYIAHIVEQKGWRKDNE